MTLPDLKSAGQLVERDESTRLVFRVYDDASYQNYHPSTGFIAYHELIGLPDLSAVQKSVEERLVFSNCKPTPWISTTRRWLWAVWEANRRLNQYIRSMTKLNVWIAIIDLNACVAASNGVSIPLSGNKHLPFIHALSALSNAQINYKRFADMSDEILIYHNVPSPAVISVWKYGRDVSPLPIQFIHSLPPSSDPELAQAFRRNYEMVADQFLEDRQNQKWNTGQIGEICAKAALMLLHDAYTRLAGVVETTVKLA